MPRATWDKKPRFNKKPIDIADPKKATATIKAAEKAAATPSKPKPAPIMSSSGTKAVAKLEKKGGPKPSLMPSSAPPALLAPFKKRGK